MMMGHASVEHFVSVLKKKKSPFVGAVFIYKLNMSGVDVTIVIF